MVCAVRYLGCQLRLALFEVRSSALSCYWVLKLSLPTSSVDVWLLFFTLNVELPLSWTTLDPCGGRLAPSQPGATLPSTPGDAVLLG